MVISQAVDGGFRLRNIDEIEESKKRLGYTGRQASPDSDEKGKGDVYVERV